MSAESRFVDEVVRRRLGREFVYYLPSSTVPVEHPRLTTRR